MDLSDSTAGILAAFSYGIRARVTFSKVGVLIHWQRKDLGLFHIKIVKRVLFFISVSHNVKESHWHCSPSCPFLVYNKHARL